MDEQRKENQMDVYLKFPEQANNDETFMQNNAHYGNHHEH